MYDSLNNRFFSKEIYESEIGLDVNQDVLDRLYSDNIKFTDQLPIEFFFITDEENKVINLKNHFITHFPTYKDLKVQSYKDNYELLGTTYLITMDIHSINKWNQQLWDIGYQFDCKLDGWQVGA
jgi:hypothetical protein